MVHITFSEFSVGTANPTYNIDGNKVFTWGGIRTDSSNPTSPVLAGSVNSFAPPVNVQFKKPVKSVSFDAGYFNDPQSTLIQFYDGAGNVLKSVRNGDQEGIENFSLTSKDGIAGFMVRATAYEAAGFAIDNLIVGKVAKNEKPPKIFETNKGGVEIGMGNISGWVGQGFSNSLGPKDVSDIVKFTLDKRAKVTFEVVLKSNPDQVETFSGKFDKGANKVEVRDVYGYDDTEAYILRVTEVKPLKASDREYDAAAADVVQAIASGVPINWGQFCLALAEHVDDAASAKQMYKAIGEKLGKAAIVLDALFRLDNVLSANNPAEEFFVQTIDFIAALGFSQGGALGGASLGPIGAFVGGLGGGLVYTFAVSNQVQNNARDFYRDNVGIGNGFAPDQLGGGAVAQIEFKANWYLNKYEDAAKDVESGKYASAYVHFLLEGAKKGYKPNKDADPIKQWKLRDGGNDNLEQIAVKGSVFKSKFGELRGDGISGQERKLIDLIVNYRTEGLTLDVDGDLAALANRKAQDLVHNMIMEPISAFYSDRTGWDDKWSAGRNNEHGAKTWFNMDVEGLAVMAVASEGLGAKEALKLFASEIESRSSILSPDFNKIGVAEYGGVWVVVLDYNTVTTPEYSKSPTELQRFGSDNPDAIFMGTWRGSANGKGGNDLLEGGARGDNLNGGKGDDQVNGKDGNDKVLGGKGNDNVLGGSGADKVFGGGGSDDLSGQDGSDVLKGGGGGDLLMGGKGNDILVAGKGKDTLKGGKGKDKFVFAPNEGVNTIKDFEPNKDKLDLSAFGFKNKNSALNKIGELGNKHDDKSVFEHKNTLVKIFGADVNDLDGGNIII